MCGRFSLDRKPEALKARFKARLNIAPDSTPLYNIAPSHMAACILNDGGEAQIELLEWGLAGKGIDGKSRNLINARSETISQKYPFKSLLSNRCLVIASGYIEWKTIGKIKIPHLHVLENGDLFVMAGIYETDQDNTKKRFTILTQASDPQASVLHDRMPFIFNEKHEKDWLDSEKSTGDILNDAETGRKIQLNIYPVSPKMNTSFKNDSSLLLRTPYTVAEQLRLF